MNKYQEMSSKDKKDINNYLIQMFGNEKIETNGMHEVDIYYYISVLKNSNANTYSGVFSRAKNVNVVLNVDYWKDIKLPSNTYVTHLPDDVLAIIFDDDIIAIRGDTIHLSQFYSCVILKP